MQWFKNISIKNKLIFIQSVTAFIAIFICSSIFVIRDIKILKESGVRKMYSIVRIIGDNSISPLLFIDQDAANKILLLLDKEPDIMDVVLLDKGGKIFGRYTRKGVDIGEFPVPDNNQTVASEFSEKKLIVTYKIFQKKEFIGTVILKAELTDLKKSISKYILVAIFILIAGLLAAFFISIFLQRAISKRLLLLVSKAKEVSETGNYSIRAPLEGKDEIATLSGEFNHMLTQIEKMEKSLSDANAGLEKRVQERTMELDAANKELESFTYSVSHDLRAPLRAIDGYIRILEEEYVNKLDKEAIPIMESVSNNAKKMGKLIDALLALSRLGKKELQKTEVDITQLAQLAVEEVKKSFDLVKTEIIIHPLPKAMADHDIILQALINLISNAVKYSSKKEKPVVEIGSKEENNEIVYYVKDNGAGFDMKYYDKLFGTFQRLHDASEFEGTGVGLALVKRIITKHNGRIWAEAEVEKGATFYFTFGKISEKKT